MKAIHQSTPRILLIEWILLILTQIHFGELIVNLIGILIVCILLLVVHKHLLSLRNLLILLIRKLLINHIQGMLILLLVLSMHL